MLRKWIDHGCKGVWQFIECPLWQAQNVCSQVVWFVGAGVGDALKTSMDKRKAEGEQSKGIF